MKDRLTAVFNALQNIPTRGESTLIMADCLRELLAIIQDLDKEEKDGVQ